jgi:aspartate kinase
MSRLVMKFGGTSVADLECIRNVALRVKRARDAGDEVAVVVSAMAGTTNQLVAWCQALSPLHDAREYDSVVATGEQVTAGLLAIALQSLGIDARSWLGWQIPLRSDDAHGRARIEHIAAAVLLDRMQAGHVPVVAGFQGVAPDGRITTLGRGGYLSRRARRSIGCRSLRHLHRRRRHLHHRSPHRVARAQTG